MPRTSRTEAFALELIVFMKALKSGALFLVGLALLALIGKDLGAIATRIAALLHLDLHREFLVHLVARLSAFSPRQVGLGAACAFGYSAILGIEAVGLQKRRAWAAWLAVFVGAALLPVEIHELFLKHGIRLYAVFLLNLTVVVYLTIEARRARRDEP